MGEMGIYDRIPCCAAEAAQRIKRININGIPTGISMFEVICLKVREKNISGEEKTADELMKEVKIYNYVPAGAYENYRSAILKEYKNGK
ncbi:hypothetical protein J2128_001924 [Methanomicrobium sp. W14]|uniref:hypothetical protein n=1 Tax=Methanomicrobium sp. W14 TaxID=2817839 RepID=UPI001FD8D335|nr:hypothetical protein [Methanomicrobium sp. W14]MBP2133958.1 hypothetical protein [Methanomicrobium sp. W14]